MGTDGARAPALMLFDIDGTLIRRAGPHHRAALVEAVRRVTGLDAPLDHIPLQGMLDRDIVTRMMLDAGATKAAVRAAMPAIVEHAQRHYSSTAPATLSGKVCPGVRGLLRRLGRAGVPMGLVTGNLSRIAWMKMDRAGLREHFRFGAFAEFGSSRAGLVRLALRQARREGWYRTGAPVWLVGDHENDIAAARANSVGSIAVATGISPRANLAACSPDLLVDDLRELKWESLFR